MANEQYLTEAHYLTCSKGAKPVRVSVDSQKSVKFSGSLAATSKDLQTKSNFICLGAVAFGAGAAVGVVATLSACALIPGPGWVVAAIIAAIIIAALLLAGGKCACAAATRFWLPGTTSQRSKLNGAPLLTLSSQMSCPAEGGCITAQATLWEAWGRQTLTNLGHIANFAFGFLVGRGASAMVVEAGAAASVSAAGQTGSQVAGTFIRSLGKNFLNTAKENLVQQFTGWNQGGMFCRFMKGFGLYGQAKEHYDIWTDDEKSTWEKIKASGMSLILDVFAAKGATTVCFPAGTKVHTQWGLADIEKLEIGVPVLTYNEETGEQEYKKVKKVMRRMTRRMCAMELSNGTTLEVTPEHRFFCDGEWIPIEELNVNDTLQLKDNSIVVIENKIIFPTFVEVYNLEIEDNENYYVTEEGVLVHNGYRAIDNAQEYEKQIQDLYGGAKTQAERAYTGIVDGLPVNGIADNVVDGIAIEAKYVEDWGKSLRNPLDTHPWAIAEQQKLINQAKKYSDAFDRVIYHTNSQEFMDHYSKVFKDNGVNNVEWILTPFKK